MKGLKIGAVALALLCGTGLYFGCQKADFFQASRGVEGLYAKAESAGWPMTSAELKGPEVPASENAAPLMIEAALDLADADIESESCEDAAEEEVFAQCLLELEPLVDSWKSATGRLRYQQALDYDFLYAHRFRDLVGHKRAASILARRAELRARRQDVSEALSDLEAIRRGAELVAQQPILIHMMVGFSLDEAALEAWLRVAQEWQDEPAHLERLAAFLEEAVPEISVQPALQGEFYSGLSLSRNIEAYGGLATLFQPGGSGLPDIEDKSAIQREGIPESVMERAFANRHLEHWMPLIEAGDLDENPQAIKKWAREAEFRIQAADTFSYSLLKAFSPTLVQVHKVSARAQARRNIVAAHLNLLRGLDTGMPDDPFAEGPLKAAEADGRTTIYSVGPDRVDDGGSRRDIAVVFPQPEREPAPKPPVSPPPGAPEPGPQPTGQEMRI